MASQKLTVDSIIKNAFDIGFKQIFSLAGALVLYILTIWIPYLNVGTTIGMNKMLINIAKKREVSPTDIFNNENYEYMGQFLILYILMFFGMMAGYMFGVIPSIALKYRWILAPFFLLEKNCTPYESIDFSTKATRGYRWQIFGGMLVLSIILIIAALVLGFILFKGIGFAGVFITAILALFVMYAVLAGAMAHIYRELTK